MIYFFSSTLEYLYQVLMCQLIWNSIGAWSNKILKMSSNGCTSGHLFKLNSKRFSQIFGKSRMLEAKKKKSGTLILYKSCLNNFLLCLCTSYQTLYFVVTFHCLNCKCPLRLFWCVLVPFLPDVCSVDFLQVFEHFILITVK